MEHQHHLLESLSNAVNCEDQATFEGSSIRSSLRRIGAQIDDLPTAQNGDFEFEAKEDHLNVWSTDLD